LFGFCFCFLSHSPYSRGFGFGDFVGLGALVLEKAEGGIALAEDASLDQSANAPGGLAYPSGKETGQKSANKFLTAAVNAAKANNNCFVFMMAIVSKRRVAPG
jgi:hypothetical protein